MVLPSALQQRLTDFIFKRVSLYAAPGLLRRIIMANTKTEKAKEKLGRVYIPKQSRNDTERFIGVNGERILVQTGRTVEIPERFAEVIKNSEKMAAVSAEYIDANISL